MNKYNKLILAIDVGTGSVRAALVDLDGTVVDLANQPHPTFYAQHGYVEQQPEDWWTGTCAAIRRVLSNTSSEHIVCGIVCCGQMHAPVLLDKNRKPIGTHVALWNDKRAAEVARHIKTEQNHGTWSFDVNPATSAWPGIKLSHMAMRHPEAIEKARHLLMPKDYINFRLTGEVAMDITESASSFLVDVATGQWSSSAAARLNVPYTLLPRNGRPSHQVGALLSDVAELLGLPKDIPVFLGAGDFPCAILGSGVTDPGQVSDITGTSFLLSRISPEPIRGAEIMNIAMVTENWGAFGVVDSAGDAVRWARRVIDREANSFETISEEADVIPAGADGLMFLPYLTGERLGQGEKSRGAFLGLKASHTPAHIYRAVMEGVVLAMVEAFSPIAMVTGPVSEIISAAGGARSDVWLRMKANILDATIIPTLQEEAGIIGCAAIGFAGLGIFPTPRDAAKHMVRYRGPILPNRDETAQYAAIYDAFRQVRHSMQSMNETVSKL